MDKELIHIIALKDNEIYDLKKEIEEYQERVESAETAQVQMENELIPANTALKLTYIKLKNERKKLKEQIEAQQNLHDILNKDLIETSEKLNKAIHLMKLYRDHYSDIEEFLEEIGE